MRINVVCSRSMVIKPWGLYFFCKKKRNFFIFGLSILNYRHKFFPRINFSFVVGESLPSFTGFCLDWVSAEKQSIFTESGLALALPLDPWNRPQGAVFLRIFRVLFLIDALTFIVFHWVDFIFAVVLPSFTMFYRVLLGFNWSGCQLSWCFFPLTFALQKPITKRLAARLPVRCSFEKKSIF